MDALCPLPTMPAINTCKVFKFTNSAMVLAYAPLFLKFHTDTQLTLLNPLLQWSNRKPLVPQA